MMKTGYLCFAGVVFQVVASINIYENITMEPASRQLFEFKLKNKKLIGLLTTSSGEPVEIRDTIKLNSDQFSSQYHLDHHTTFDAERIVARVVHGKGTGASGYFVVTNNVTKYTSADLFSRIGKKTPLVARLSNSPSDFGGSDLTRELKGMAIKFYTKEGNLDLLCLHAPVYLYKDPANFSPMVHAFRKDPRSSLINPTMSWDFITLRPELMHNFLWMLSDFGLPDGYRKMDAFPVHTYELSNKNGDRSYVKFNFRTEQGLNNLTSAQAATIQGKDLDYYVRDLYNAIALKQYPSWRLEVDVLTLDDLKTVDYDPFDVTRMWKKGTYKTVEIGRIVLNKNPENMFRTIELSAFNPGNLVPGIPGPVDSIFKERKMFYRDTQDYRLGTSHNKIEVNLPRYANTYNRDGVPPVNDNMKDVPNYYPNSFGGPMPYVDETRPVETLLVLERQAADFQSSADFYNIILVNDAQRQRLVDNLVASLVSVTPPVQKRALKMMYLIDLDLGKRIDIGVKAAVDNVRRN